MRIIADSAMGYAEEFASWGEYIDALKERTDKCPQLRKEAVRSKHGSCGPLFFDAKDSWRHFTGTDSFKEALGLATDGWPEGLDKARKLANPLFEKVSHLIERVEPVYDIEGGALDIGRYHDNDPEMFCRFDNVIAEAAGNRVIRLLVNVGASYGISNETIMSKGATIASLVELLELVGNRVELTVIPFAGDQRNGFKCWTKVIIKQAEQPLDLGIVAFAMAHPSSLRRLSFAWLNTLPDQHYERVMHAYGAPVDVEHAGYDVYIQKSHLNETQWANPESATAWILQSLKEQGVSLKEE